MTTRWIFGSHLSHDLPIVKEADKETDVFLFVEAHSRSTWQNYHKQKLVLVFSAMRHFAEELKNKGYTVDYREAGEKRAEEDKEAIRKKAASLKAQLASGAFHLDNKTTSYSD
ncbi:cryptochrome/photolyase family protein [Chryseomicrobium aureum]|uniref:cryptochrome/photolyase family protein n=1 Tax=Chryseomicrobium aureum TaxID=1441723 RepID=UPI00370DC62C